MYHVPIYLQNLPQAHEIEQFWAIMYTVLFTASNNHQNIKGFKSIWKKYFAKGSRITTPHTPHFMIHKRKMLLNIAKQGLTFYTYVFSSLFVLSLQVFPWLFSFVFFCKTFQLVQLHYRTCFKSTMSSFNNIPHNQSLSSTGLS